jgi:hypothetical protein
MRVAWGPIACRSVRGMALARPRVTGARGGSSPWPAPEGKEVQYPGDSYNLREGRVTVAGGQLPRSANGAPEAWGC